MKIDQEKLQEIYKEYTSKLIGTVHNILIQHCMYDTAPQDIVQAAIEKLWIKTRTNDNYVRDERHLSSWLYLVCKNWTLKAINRANKRVDVGSSFDISSMGEAIVVDGRKCFNTDPTWASINCQEDPSIVVSSADKKLWVSKNLKKLLKRLSKSEHEVFVLRLKGLGFDEIAKKLKIRTKTVHARFHAGCVRIRKILSFVKEDNIKYAA